RSFAAHRIAGQPIPRPDRRRHRPRGRRTRGVGFHWSSRLGTATYYQQYAISSTRQSHSRAEEFMKNRTVSVAGMANPVRSHPLTTGAGPFLFMSGQMGLSEKSGRPFQSYEELGGEPPYPALGLLAPNTWEEAFVTQTKTIYDRIATLLGD